VVEDPVAYNSFSPSVVGLAVEFPLYQLGHVAKPGENARAAEFVADKKNKSKERNNNESTDSV
jgi:hypothetical protein